MAVRWPRCIAPGNNRASIAKTFVICLHRGADFPVRALMSFEISASYWQGCASGNF